jgi:HEAT repeats
MVDRLKQALARRSGRVAPVLIIIFGLAGAAYGMATEHFGNAPVPAGYHFGKEVLELANLPERVYWYEVNGDPWFFYHGDTIALNTALRRFAATPASRHEVILIPGPGKTNDLSGKKAIACDWYLHAPEGLYRIFAQREKRTRVYAKDPVMVVYVSWGLAAAAVNHEQLAKWIADLDSDQFALRDKATQALAKTGPAARPALRQALKGRPSAEKGRRIEQLLARFQGIDLQLLEIPARVTLLNAADMIERYRAGLQSTEPMIRGHAAGSLGELAPYSDKVIPLLIDVLRADRHEYVRRSTAAALARLGHQALSALPVLKAGINDPDQNVSHMFREAVQRIEGAKAAKGDTPSPAEREALLKDIDRYRKSVRHHDCVGQSGQSAGR